ncbi:putative nuclease HARBI1 [Merluccius polli]|uniref:Nuclease HARBI1 n=1 Tax=Merluccius polli TaxID=89951 RepID=A0AA47NR82_MERPO|nr:putative nuclease HARBI1 [Merluccius polli]
MATKPPAATPPPFARAAADIMPAAYDPAVIPATVNPTAPRTRGAAATFIRFPLDNQQLHRIKANFMACRYAGVVGAVDGTHIQIIAPSKDEDVFVNRKNVHSINTQIVFDATFYILDVAKWPRVYP